jgi:predicted GNAT superfamily acetyltransferase
MSVMSTPDQIAEATEEARRSAARAGVSIRGLDGHRELGTASELLGQIWGLVDPRDFLEPSLLVAMEHAGNYVVGAFENEEMVGACMGFFAMPLGSTLHSHITGVVPRLAGRGVGTALKLHQRAWCLARGITRVTWTYDPLVGRNAAFNLSRLGVRVEEYLVDFYGPMTDGRNRGQPTDRLMVAWDLLGVRSESSNDDTRPPHVTLGSSADGAPLLGSPPSEGERRCAVRVPVDVEELRAADADLATRWRYAVRAVMTTLLDDGWTVVGFDRAGGGYLFERG